jgi:hypothetical protein
MLRGPDCGLLEDNWGITPDFGGLPCSSVARGTITEPSAHSILMCNTDDRITRTLFLRRIAGAPPRTQPLTDWTNFAPATASSTSVAAQARSLWTWLGRYHPGRSGDRYRRRRDQGGFAS